MKRRGAKTGFTLIELLVVVSIIALLVSILLPALGKAKEQAQRVVCASNIKQLLTGEIAYAGENRGMTPLWWDGVNPDTMDYFGCDLTTGIAEHLKYYGRKVSIGRLYPGYISDGHAFYCPSKTANRYEDPGDQYYNGLGTDSGFKHMLPTHLCADPSYCHTGSSYQVRGCLDPSNLMNAVPYRVVKVTERYPRWIIIADYGGMKYGGPYDPYAGIINHQNSQGLPIFFNNGYADGHVQAYFVKHPEQYPLVSSPFDGGLILQMMERGEW
jgi:prepilin-type N-terminal cleavage/methylation domain-containing protein